MQADGRGVVLDQFANPDNPRAHIESTGPEIWNQTEGRVTHFVSAMGTTGTIMGVSTYLKSRNAAIQVVGAQPAEGSQIPGIRKWPEAYLPKIFDRSRVDAYESIVQADAETMARRLAAEEGIFAGISSAGALVAAARGRKGERCDHRLHRLRPGRPLPVHGCVQLVHPEALRASLKGRRYGPESEARPEALCASPSGRRDGPAKPAPCGLD